MEKMSWIRLVYKVFVVVSLKITAFWDMVLCSLIRVEQDFRCAYCLHHQGDNGGSTHLWNIGLFLWDYMVPYPRKLSSISVRLYGATSQKAAVYFYETIKCHIPEGCHLFLWDWCHIPEGCHLFLWDCMVPHPRKLPSISMRLWCHIPESCCLFLWDYKVPYPRRLSSISMRLYGATFQKAAIYFCESVWCHIPESCCLFLWDYTVPYTRRLSSISMRLWCHMVFLWDCMVPYPWKLPYIYIRLYSAISQKAVI
jgi:hypothetical protein